MNSKSYRTVSSNVCRVNRLMVLDSTSFYGKESSGQQFIEYNIDSIINVLRSCGLSSDTTTITQQAIITGLNNIGNSSQGKSVAISSDGNTVAIGCPYNNESIGAVIVFIRVGVVWEQQYGLIIGTGYATESTQGMSVALSSNGNTLAIGGPGDNNGIGATWVFVRTSSSWTQQGSKLIGSGYSGIPRQGTSVSLSSDGNTLAVGGSDDSAFLGATWVFTRSGSSWTQQGSKLIGSGYTGSPRQGVSVSLSSNGNTLAVGGDSDNSDIGAVWVFFRTGVTWAQQSSPKLVGTGNVSASGQGRSVALSQDGNTLVIGAPENDSGIGAIWIFKRSLTIWNQMQGPIIGTAASGASRQGCSVAISQNTIIVGGLGNNENIGSFWMFGLNENNWEQKGYRVTGSGYTGTPLQGTSVSISSDESTIIIGGPGNNNGIGSSWIFTL